MFLQATTSELLPTFCKGSSTLFPTEMAGYKIIKKMSILSNNIFCLVKCHGSVQLYVILFFVNYKYFGSLLLYSYSVMGFINKILQLLVKHKGPGLFSPLGFYVFTTVPLTGSFVGLYISAKCSLCNSDRNSKCVT